LPRSIVAWFAVCWGLFLVAARVVGGLLIALYKETTTQRTDRAAASIAVACDAIVRESRSFGETDGRTANTRYAAAVNGALEQFAGVEGGVWKTGSGLIAYAFPTYRGSGQKTDLPQAEEPTIKQVETAATAHRPVEWKRDAGSQVLLIHACPISNAAEGIAAWTMTRVVATQWMTTDSTIQAFVTDPLTRLPWSRQRFPLTGRSRRDSIRALAATGQTSGPHRCL
jgi:hypothetical protein